MIRDSGEHRPLACSIRPLRRMHLRKQTQRSNQVRGKLPRTTGLCSPPTLYRRRRKKIVGYHADAVQNFFGDGSRYNIEIQYATQVVQDGTGRVVDLARNFASDSPFVLNYGDILVDPANYKRLLDLPHDTEAIISVTRGEDVSKGGAVFLNERMELVDLREKSKPGEPTSPWYNAGIYAFRSSIFEFTAKLKPSPRGEYELTDAIRALAQSGKKVKALELSGEWADVRDPETLAKLNQ